MKDKVWRCWIQRQLVLRYIMVDWTGYSRKEVWVIEHGENTSFIIPSALTLQPKIAYLYSVLSNTMESTKLSSKFVSKALMYLLFIAFRSCIHPLCSWSSELELLVHIYITRKKYPNFPLYGQKQLNLYTGQIYRTVVSQDQSKKKSLLYLETWLAI